MVALVLLPGLDGTGLLFADFAASFGPDVKVIVASYPSDVPLGYPELESVARSFLPQGEPFFLLAESFSGPIAICIAASPPPGLLGLVLCCSFARNPLPLLAFLRPAVGVLPLRLPSAGLLAFMLLGRFGSGTLRDALGRSLALVAPAVLRARAHAALSVDVSARLCRIRVPVLYLRASEDRIVFAASGELIASNCGQVEVVEFTAPHFLLQVLPSRVAERVAEFMRGVFGLQQSG